MPTATEQKQLTRQNGDAIREFREKEGLSQTELGAAAGITQPGLSQIENGRVNAEMITLNRIARALGITVASILRQPVDEAA